MFSSDQGVHDVDMSYYRDVYIDHLIKAGVC
jgi:hypothetical protein